MAPPIEMKSATHFLSVKILVSTMEDVRTSAAFGQIFIYTKRAVDCFRNSI